MRFERVWNYEECQCFKCKKFLTVDDTDQIYTEFGVRYYLRRCENGPTCFKCYHDLRYNSKPRVCFKCGERFDSGNALFRHLKEKNHYV